MLVAEKSNEIKDELREPQADYPGLPPICDAGGVLAPAAPTQIDEMDVGIDVLRDLAVKLAQNTPNFTTTDDSIALTAVGEAV